MTRLTEMANATHAFGSWTEDGSEFVSVVDDNFDPSWSPWVVQARSGRLIGCNLLVFAANGEHAIERVKSQWGRAIKEAGPNCYPVPRGYDEFSFSVEPFERAKITKVAWSANDTVRL